LVRIDRGDGDRLAPELLGRRPHEASISHDDELLARWCDEIWQLPSPEPATHKERR
jgi:hypothetical protein